MFILLGAPDDPCLAAVKRALAARGRQARIIDDPFAGSATTSLRFDRTRSQARLALDGEIVALDGVLASRRALPQVTASDQWSQEDSNYRHAEREAALLGWLWSLPCPVIDRWPAWLWYRTHRPLLVWRALLQQCGLPPLDSIMSGDIDEISRFLQAHGGGALEPVVGGGARQLIHPSEASEAGRTAAMAPVRLTTLHGGAWRACLAGSQLIWDDGTPAEADHVAPRLRAFAAHAGLCLLEFVVTCDDAPRIVDIEPAPRFELFGAGAQAAIAQGLAEALLQSAAHGSEVTQRAMP